MTIDSRQAAGSDGRPLKVGILGAGYIADWHLKALRRVRQAQVVALADLDIRRARSLSADYSIAQAYGSLEEMLAGESLDVLHVLTPPQTHYPAAKLALESGVHVLLEKPMCIDRRHAIELNLLAQSRTRCVGVNHNFLFTKEYEQLRSALTAGSIGRIDHVSIVWNKPLGQLVSGPFDLWMLREPQNIVLEIGPHLVAHLLDLVDYPQAWRVHVDNEAELPGQRTFYRRWRLSTDHGRAAADLLMSFNPGNTEHYIHVRGSNGSARVDFENQTFALDRPTPYGVDFDRYRRVRASARAVGRQARRNLIDYVLSKFKLSERGNAFGYSIQRSLQAFYASVTGAADSRMSTQLGVDVVNLCHDIADQVRSDIPPPEAVCSAKPLVVANHRRGESDVFHTGLNGTATASCSTACALADREYVATTLVLGGTGFIGKELVRQLVERNYRVKVLSRASATPGDLFEHPAVEMVRGSMANPAVLAGALEGVDHVFHLARAHVKRWADWQQLDVQGTKTVAEACLRAGVKRLIYTGTIDSYYAGRGAGTIREETGLDRHIRRRNYYARAKCEAESLLLDLHRRHRLPVVIFRPGIVLGPGGSPFHWGVGMWSGNTVCQLWGEGKHPLPIVLVSDVAAAMIAAIDEPGIEGESFNLVGEPSLSAREYLDELGRTLNVRLDVIPKPIWQFYLADMLKWCVKCAVRHPDRKLPSYRDWESRTQRARFDCTKAQQRLKWRPTTDRARIVREGIVEPAAEFAQ